MLKKDLLYPTIDQLLAKVNSKFELSFIIGKIAYSLQKENQNLEEKEAIALALEKIIEKKFKINL